jgi:hypothetical protein
MILAILAIYEVLIKRDFWQNEIPLKTSVQSMACTRCKKTRRPAIPA